MQSGLLTRGSLRVMRPVVFQVFRAACSTGCRRMKTFWHAKALRFACGTLKNSSKDALNKSGRLLAPVFFWLAAFFPGRVVDLLSEPIRSPTSGGGYFCLAN